MGPLRRRLAGVTRIVVDTAPFIYHFPDALQLGACIQHGCEVFITNDRRLKRVSEIDVLVLADYVD